MIADAERRSFDIIVCEALDRIGRDFQTSPIYTIACAFSASPYTR